MTPEFAASDYYNYEVTAQGFRCDLHWDGENLGFSILWDELVRACSDRNHLRKVLAGRGDIDEWSRTLVQELHGYRYRSDERYRAAWNALREEEERPEHERRARRTPEQVAAEERENQEYMSEAVHAVVNAKLRERPFFRELWQAAGAAGAAGATGATA